LVCNNPVFFQWITTIKIHSSLIFSKIPNEKITVHLMGREMWYLLGMICNLGANLVATHCNLCALKQHTCNPCGRMISEFQYLPCSFVADSDIMRNTVLYPDTLPYNHNTKKCEAVFHYLFIFFHPVYFEIDCSWPTYVMCPLHINPSAADIIEKWITCKCVYILPYVSVLHPQECIIQYFLLLYATLIYSWSCVLYLILTLRLPD